MSKLESISQPDNYQSVWVRGYDPQTNVFTLATLDENNPEVIRVSPDENSPLGRKATEVLRDCYTRRKQARESVMVVFGDKVKGGRRGEPGDVETVVVDVLPPTLYRDRDARRIVAEDGKLISTWSEGLDESFDRYQDAVVAQAAFQYHSLLMANPDSFEKARDQAAVIFHKLAGKSLKDAEVQLPAHYVAAMHGFEGEIGKPSQVRYNLLASFREQCTAETGSRKWLTAAANFSMQKAFLDAFVASAVAGEKSFLHEVQDEFLQEKTLIAGHPYLDATEFSRKSKEVAIMVGAHVTAGIMAHTNATAASADLDEMKHPGVHGEIEAEYQNLAEAARFDQPRALGAYLSLGETRLGRYEANLHFKVYEEQLKTVGPKVTPPVPPQDHGLSSVILGMNRALAAANKPPVEAAKLKEAVGKQTSPGHDTIGALRELVKITVKDMEAAINELEAAPII